MVEVTKLERTNEMTADRIATAIERRSQTDIPSRTRTRRGPAGVMRSVFRTSVTQEELDDKARWLDGQVRGWAAARTL